MEIASKGMPGFKPSRESRIGVPTTVNIEVYCDATDGEREVFGVVSEHRSDLPKPFDEPLQEWVRTTFDYLDVGDRLPEAGEMVYEPNNTIIEFRKKVEAVPRRFGEGDPVRVDIPNETDVDHDVYHDRHGMVVEILEDDAGSETGDPRDSVLYRVELASGESASFRWRDLRPVTQEP